MPVIHNKSYKDEGIFVRRNRQIMCNIHFYGVIVRTGTTVTADGRQTEAVRPLELVQDNSGRG